MTRTFYITESFYVEGGTFSNEVKQAIENMNKNVSIGFNTAFYVLRFTPKFEGEIIHYYHGYIEGPSSEANYSKLLASLPCIFSVVHRNIRTI